MKKLLIALFACFAFVACNKTEASNNKYEVLEPALELKNSPNSVVEIFSYACIHCYNQHKAGTLAKVQKDFPDVKFDMWQVALMGQYGEAFVRILAFANAMDDAKEISYISGKSITHKILNAYFGATFVKRVDFASEAEFYELGLGVFKGAGFDADREIIESYAMTDVGKARINVMGSGLEIAKYVGTPAIVVNGKYLVRNENIESNDEFVKVIKELLKK